VTLGIVGGRIYAVAFTIRAGRVRLISGCKANPRERARYAAASP
jgi:uncharacterized DUF497 family protein